MACNRKEMKSQKEIELAHDLVMTALEMAKKQNVNVEHSLVSMLIIRDTLCWALNHSEQTLTQILLDGVNRMLQGVQVAALAHVFGAEGNDG